MAISDANGLPIGFSLHGAERHETQCIEDTLDSVVSQKIPFKLFGDKAYDSFELQSRIHFNYCCELSAPFRSNSLQLPADNTEEIEAKKKGRFKIERLFSWLKSFRRLVVRWEYHPENFLAMVKLASIVLLLNRF